MKEGIYPLGIDVMPLWEFSGTAALGITSIPDDKRVYNRAASVLLMNKICEHLGLIRFSIVGNSLGGYLAWAYASAHPEKIDKLVLIDAVGFPMKLPWILRFAAHPLIRPFARLTMPRFFSTGPLTRFTGIKTESGRRPEGVISSLSCGKVEKGLY